MIERTIGYLAVLILSVFSVSPLIAQSSQTGTPQVGYVIISPGVGNSTSPPNLRISQTFAFVDGGFEQRTELPAPQMTTSALLFATSSESLGRDTGVAIANPGSTPAQIRMTLFRDDGVIAAQDNIAISGRQQMSRLLTELFSNQPGVRDFTGTLRLDSSVPVAVLAVRLQGMSFSTETLSQLSAPAPIPPIISGISGGSPLFILPNFVAGGGWATEITIINESDSSTASVRLDLFSASGSPLNFTLNGVTASTFPSFTIRPRGVIVIASPDSEGTSRF